MTNPNVPNPNGNPNYVPNFDPNKYPAAAAVEYMLPTDPAEFQQKKEDLRRMLGNRVQMLEEAANKPADQRSEKENQQLMWAAHNMKPVEENGKRYFANLPYNTHPLSEGKPHGIQDNEKTHKVFETGRHLINEALLKQEHDAREAAKAELAEKQRREDKAREDAEKARDALNNRTPVQVETDSRASYGNLLAWATDPRAPEMTKDDFKAAEADAKTLRPEERYRLQLELEDWLKNNENASGRANNLKITIEQGLAKDMETHRAFSDEKKARDAAINKGEIEPGDLTPLGRFERIKAGFIEDKIKAVEKADAAEAWDEAHPTTETKGMIGLHKFMLDHARREQYGVQRSKRQERKVQSELIELLAKDARALEAFRRSEFAASKKILKRVDELLDNINDPVGKYNSRVAGLDENDPNNLDKYGINRATKRFRTHLREKGGLATYQEMTNLAHRGNKKGQALYNELQANRMPRKVAMMDAGKDVRVDSPEDATLAALAAQRPRSRYYYANRKHSSPASHKAYDKDMAPWQRKVDAVSLPEFGPKADPAVRMTETRRTIIDRLEGVEGSEPFGDTLSDGRLSNWLIRKAQKSELARAAKGDPAAEAELRRRGIRVPRLATNRQKNDARVDKINNAYDKLTGTVRKVASKVRQPRRPRS